MILVSTCPGGNVSNFFSSLAKANVPLSVSLTAVSTLLATLMTPTYLAFGQDCIWVLQMQENQLIYTQLICS